MRTLATRWETLACSFRLVHSLEKSTEKINYKNIDKILKERYNLLWADMPPFQHENTITNEIFSLKHCNSLSLKKCIEAVKARNIKKGSLL